MSGLTSRESIGSQGWGREVLRDESFRLDPRVNRCEELLRLNDARVECGVDGREPEAVVARPELEPRERRGRGASGESIVSGLCGEQRGHGDD